MAQNLEVIIGTYEEFLVGYKIEKSKDENLSLIQSFASRSHSASIRCLASFGKYIASGGADDRIFVYDMKARKEVHVLMHHNGTINSITFTPDGTHMLSGADDGQMIAFNTKTWQTNAVWKKAHSGKPVTQIICHPSGKIALSLGNDLTLRTWNLIKGRNVYTTNLKSKKSLGNAPDCLSWSIDGDYFTLTGPNIVEIWNIENAGVIKDERCDSRPTCVCWITNDCVLVGLQSGKLMMISTDTDEKANIFEAHERRVKCMCYLNDTLATASSSGEVYIWTVDIENQTINKISSTNIGCRPTCIKFLDLTQFGDDYNLKADKEQEIEKNNEKNQNQKKIFGGSVTIEFDNDDDDDDDHNSDDIKLDSSLEDIKIKNQTNEINSKVKLKRKILSHSEVETTKLKKKKHVTKINKNNILSIPNQSDESESNEDEKPNFVRIKKRTPSSNVENKKLNKKPKPTSIPNQSDESESDKDEKPNFVQIKKRSTPSSKVNKLKKKNKMK